jgi:hypothetical protein
VYDFAGFDRRYFEMTYPTPDAGALAARVAAAMPDSEPVHQHAGRGLDHRAWVPLKVKYPDGDVPVLQLSMPPWPATVARPPACPTPTRPSSTTPRCSSPSGPPPTPSSRSAPPIEGYFIGLSKRSFQAA